MKINTLTALANLAKTKNLDLQDIYLRSNRINSVGIALEYFIKDSFCDTFELEEVDRKDEEYQKHFSWLGTKNHPPDFIIRGGDGIEVKKIAGLNTSTIALNSSYPKDYLHKDSPRLTKGCRACEDDIGGWKQKDFAYIVGVVTNKRVKRLWFVYGDCYAASREVYKNLFDQISDGIESSLGGLDLTETTELGKIKRLDPLGITDLRMRGMWNIVTPHKVFSYLTDSSPVINALMLKKKYDILRGDMSKEKNSLLEEAYEIREVDVKDPNNPAKNLEGVLIQNSFQYDL